LLGWPSHPFGPHGVAGHHHLAWGWLPGLMGVAQGGSATPKNGLDLGQNGGD